jgi:hypothetical protein
MNIPLNMPCGLKKGSFLFLWAFLVPALVCLGQTNSDHRVVPSHQPGHVGVFWDDAANGYYAPVEVSTQTQPAPVATKTPAKPKDLGNRPAPRQAAGPRQMNLEADQQAQYQRIDEERLLQTREVSREAEHNRELAVEMGALSHDPESLIWGTPITATRVLGTGTASGVP